MSTFTERPLSSKRTYWEFGKHIDQGIHRGENLDAILAELQKEHKDSQVEWPNKPSASKLRKAYSLYVEEYGFTFEELENVSAFDLYNAYSSGLGIVKSRDDAKRLIKRLKSGEHFNVIRREFNAPLETRAEQIIDAVYAHISSLELLDGKTSQTVSTLVDSYRSRIKAARGNSQEAEKLLLQYNLEIIEHLSIFKS